VSLLQNLATCVDIGVRAGVRGGPPESGKTFFQAIPKFFRQQPATTNDKEIPVTLFYLLDDKSAQRDEVVEIGAFLLG